MMQPGTRLGPYEILDRIGAGGMGEVFRARDCRLGRTVAIKLLPDGCAANPTRRERFTREARAISSLAHPHICALHDVGTQDGTDYLVMEFLEGRTLENRLLAGPLDPDEAFRYAIEIADALAHAHDRDVVHRDLKPSNIVLTADGAMLLDFGLAKLLEPDRGSGTGRTLSLTAEHRVLGTLCYMAPEQVDGGPVDARSDIFAFGAVLYEMLSGHKAFDGPTSSAVMAAILTGDPPPLSTTRRSLDGWPDVDHLVTRCLAKRPDERWQSAGDVAAELRWIVNPRSPAVAARRRPALKSGLGRRRWPAILLVAAAAAVLTAVMLTFAPSGAPSPPAAIRFTVDPPAGSTFSRSGGFMAISPNGLMLAFVATPAGGKPLLWIRPLERETAYPLTGTEGASQPFWSPDSRFLAFLADGRLRKIEAAGGAPVTICDGPAALAGTWNRHGVIVFTEMADALYQVSANGGTREPVTRLDASRGEEGHGWPVFLPDQSHLLFSILSSRAENAGVFVGAPNSAERTRLLDANSNAVFVEPGYVLYMRGGILVAQRFDAGRRKMTGEPLPLVDGVEHNQLTGKGAFTVSNAGILAYRTVVPSQLRVVDRTGQLTRTLGEPAAYLDPTLSPDGTRVAVARRDPTTGTSNIWLIDASRGVGTRLTSLQSDDDAPVWSPDGTNIVFEAVRGDRLLVRRRGTNPGDPEDTLYGSPYAMTPTDWSLDGRTVLCEAFERGGQGHVSVLPLSGEAAVTPRSWSAGQQARLSGDTRWVAYVSSESGTDEVYLRPFPAGNRRWRISTAGGTEPRWRADQREIFYLAPDGTMMSVDVSLGRTVSIRVPRRLFATHLSGSRARVRGRNQYDVSKDGQRFLLNESVTTPVITVTVNWPTLLPH